MRLTFCSLLLYVVVLLLQLSRRLGWLHCTWGCGRRYRFTTPWRVIQFTLFFRWVLSVFFKRTIVRGHECSTLYWWKYGTVYARHILLFATRNYSQTVGLLWPWEHSFQMRSPVPHLNMNELPIVFPPLAASRDFRGSDSRKYYRFVCFWLYLLSGLLTLPICNRWLRWYKLDACEFICIL